MTFCFATWRKPTRKLRVANAGQTQPFLLPQAAAANS